MQELSEFPDSHLRIFDRPAPPEHIREVYLIGICGTGMGSLAGLLQQAGYAVSGSDAAAYPPMSTRLAAMGIAMHNGYDAAHLSCTPDLVIVGNACVPTHVEAAAARERNVAQLSLPEALAHFFLRGRHSVVVAGTHGKTTTTGLLVHLLRTAGLDPGFLIGGVLSTLEESYGIGTGRHFVVEGDEYDSAYFDKRPKFMHYRPRTAIITSMEFDHADIYEDWEQYRDAFRRFAALVDPEGLLVLCGDDLEVRGLQAYARAQTLVYGLVPGADVTARDIVAGPEGQEFTLIANGREYPGMVLPMSGRHNLLNALAACAVALHSGAQDVSAGLACFAGMKRRQEVLGTIAGITVVDDFAHHPTAVRATIRSVRERWPERRLVAIFEPRSNSSRRKVFERPYTMAFDDADLAFLCAPPFRHNDEAHAFMDAEQVASGIDARGTPAFVFEHTDSLLLALMGHASSGDIMLLMSNGSFGGLHQRLLDSLDARIKD